MNREPEDDAPLAASVARHGRPERPPAAAGFGKPPSGPAAALFVLASLVTCASVPLAPAHLLTQLRAGELSGAEPDAVLDAASIAWDAWASAHAENAEIEELERQRAELHVAALRAARAAEGDPADARWLEARDRLLAWLANRGATR